MPRWLAITLTGVASFLVLSVVAVVAIGAYMGNREAIAEAREIYDGNLESYTSAQERLESRLTDAQNTLDTTDADELDDDSLLDKLTGELDSAQGVYDQHADRKEFDVASSSVDELSVESEDIDGAASAMNTAAESLDSADQEVSDSYWAKKEADAEKQAAEKEEKAKKSARSISYEELFRAGDSLVGEYFSFEGQIIQDAGSGVYRVNVTRDAGYSMDFWEDTVLLTVSPMAEVKLLEDDVITFVARSEGTETYESIMGASIEIPSVSADGADVTLSSHG
ncbi:MAG: hypothetical protein ACTH2U_07830 [Brevibacterium sp.]